MKKKPSKPAAAPEPARRGRPPLDNPDNVRHYQIKVRASTGELERLEAAAAKDGKPLRSWMRDLAMARAKRLGV